MHAFRDPEFFHLVRRAFFNHADKVVSKVRGAENSFWHHMVVGHMVPRVKHVSVFRGEGLLKSVGSRYRKQQFS